MSYISATEIGQHLGLSYQKINKVLAENCLYDAATKRPTAHALECGLGKTRSAVSRYTGKAIEFNVWHYEKLVELFPKPKKKVESLRLRHSGDAYHQICNSLIDFGDILKIEPSRLTKGISVEAHNAVIQAYFGDLHFIHGLQLLHGFFSAKEALAAQLVTLRISKELYEAAKHIRVRRANFNLHAIEITMQWLRDRAG